MVYIDKWLCKSCGHKWIRRSNKLPQSCPKCKSKSINAKPELDRRFYSKDRDKYIGNVRAGHRKKMKKWGIL